MVWQKINYIHANPVKAGLCKSGKDYRWSSFNAFYGSLNEPLPVDREWWWKDDAEKLSKAMKELGWRSWEKRNENQIPVHRESESSNNKEELIDES